jgi:hypothetical protein
MYIHTKRGTRTKTKRSSRYGAKLKAKERGRQNRMHGRKLSARLRK